MFKLLLQSSRTIISEFEAEDDGGAVGRVCVGKHELVDDGETVQLVSSTGASHGDVGITTSHWHDSLLLVY